MTRRPGDYGGTNGGLAAGIADPDYLDHLDIPERDHPAPSPNGHTQATPSPVAEVDPARAVEQEKIRQRVVRAARRELDAEETAAAFREPPSRRNLREELTIPDKPITYRIADIMPTGSNTTVTAQWKAGKTTIGDNLARSLADGEPFLGRFDVHPVDGTIALWNYEVHEDQYRRWLRQLGVRNQEAICPLNLRGYRLPLTVPYVEDWVVRWLEERDVKVWALDPFARAFVGSGNENDNTDVGAWLDTLDVIKSRAGVSELILPLHTGRVEHEPGEERARGATRLDDWADGRWVLTKDKQETRYFSAMGRDVEFKESALHYDETTRRLTISGGSRAKESDKRIQDAVVSVSQTTPGITKNQLRVAVRQIVGKVTNTAIDDAATCAELGHRIRIELGANRSHRHYPASHQ